MKLLCTLILVLCGAVIFANNMELTGSMYLAPSSECNKNIHDTLKSGKAQQLFTAKIIGFSGVTSGCSLINHFGFQKTGFSFKTTQNTQKNEKKIFRITIDFDWTLLSGGPFKASEKESFFEGTVVPASA